MRDPALSNRFPPHPQNWVGWLIALQLLLGVPMLFLPFSPWQFLPSLAWAEVALVPAIVTGLVFAAFILWVNGKYVLFQSRNTSSKTRIGRLVLAPAIWFVFGYMIVLVLLPMVDAAVFGERVTRTHVVDRVRPAARILGRIVSVEGLPWWSGNIYGLPRAFREQLGPGMAVVISGRGTERGLFVSYVRLAE